MKEKYIHHDGSKYDSYQDYCNSPNLDTDLIYSLLARGKRTPQNEKEKKWQKEGAELLKNGGYDISFN